MATVFDLDGEEYVTPSIDFKLGGKKHVWLFTGERVLRWARGFRKLLGTEGVKEGELSEEQTKARIEGADKLALMELVRAMLSDDPQTQGLAATLSYAAVLGVAIAMCNLYSAEMKRAAEEPEEKKDGNASA